MSPVEHPFAQYIRILGKGKTGSRSLNRTEAEQAMQLILQGNAEPEQVGAFLMLLRVKEESPEEIAGFVQACRAQITANPNIDICVDLDWSSYAGKRRQPNWYILAALLLASHGYKVFMHGARGHTEGRLYTEDIFAALGLPIARNWQQLADKLQQHNIAYMPLAAICPPLDQMIQLRQLFGLRSPVHTLCRLLNPLRSPATLQAVFHPGYSDTHNQAAELLGERHAAVFKGEAGEFEYRPQANLRIKTLHNGSTSEFTLARGSGLKAQGEPSAEVLAQLWNDRQKTADLNEEQWQVAEEIVQGTAALALMVIGGASDSDRFSEAQAKARVMWKDRNRGFIDSLKS